MSRDLGRDVPDLENFIQENFGLIFRTLLKCLILMVASVVKNPTLIRVTLLRGRVLSGWALWRLRTSCATALQDIATAFQSDSPKHSSGFGKRVF